jgi:hypothetical protein
MTYGYFIKNLPDEIVKLINSFVEPETDYYIDLLKEKVKNFCLNGLMRIDDCGLNINHSYFSKKEFFEEFEEKKYRININKNIDKILKVRDTFKKIYKPSTKKTKTTRHLKNVIEEVIETDISNGIMIMALILLGVKYKKKYVQDTDPVFYCNINDKTKKIIKTIYILEDKAIKRLKENFKNASKIAIKLKII